MRCAICLNKRRCVMGDGPKPSRVMAVGEAPGKDEDTGGRPFIGQTGKEWNETYLPLAGLSRDDVYVTNTVHCRPDANRKPTYKEVVGCSSHFLPEELAEVMPEVVVLMGATACSMIDGGIDLEAEHGIPRLGELYGWSGWIVPMYHPASGLHDTSMMIPLLEDWEKLRGWLEHGEWQWPIDDTIRDYRLVQSHRDIYESVPLSRIQGIGFDTETHDGVPYSFQYSLEPYNARMVLLKDTQWVKEVVELLNSIQSSHVDKGHRRPPEGQWIAMHYAPADLPIAEMIGLKVGNLRDTILEAYGFGGQYGRLGLKVLARRVLGRTRLSWEETVTPYSKEVLAQWIMKGYAHAEQTWQQQIPRYHKISGKPLKPTLIRSLPEKLLPELLQYSLNNTDYPIWQKLTERMPDEWLQKLIEFNGEVPQKGIAHCPLDAQVEYACSDADDTRQLAIEFDRMRKELIEVLDVQEEDEDEYESDSSTDSRGNAGNAQVQIP